MQKFTLRLLAVILMTLTTRDAYAQSSTSAVIVPDKVVESAGEPNRNMNDACTYETCALRLTMRRGTWRILQGEQDSEVGKLGFRAPDLTNVLGSSKEATQQYVTFKKHYVNTGVLVAIGTAAFFGGFASIHSSSHPVQSWAVAMGGAGIMLAGAKRMNVAVDALSKALWLYNKSLRH